MAWQDYPWQWREIPEEDYDGGPMETSYFVHNGYEVVEYYQSPPKLYNIFIEGTDDIVGQMLESEMRAFIGWEDAS